MDLGSGRERPRPSLPAAGPGDEGEAPLAPGKLRPPSAIDPRPFDLEPSERPRRSKGLLATGIVLTSVSPVAMMIGLLVNTGGDQAGKNVASVLCGIAGAGTGVLMIVHGAHRLTPEELEERRREERRGDRSSALVPAVSVGLGAIQAAWTF